MPQEVQVVIYRALAKNPTKRYQTCQELLSDLERFRNRQQAVGVDEANVSLPTQLVSRRNFKKYAEEASAPISRAGDEKLKSRRWLLGSCASLAILAGLWFSLVRPWVRNHATPPPKQTAVVDSSSLASKDSSVPEAYEAYLKALSYIQRYDKPANLDLAISQLQLAVAHDPQFAVAYAELGEAYRLKYQLDHDSKWIDEALAACKKALALNNRLSAIYVTLGRIHNDSGNHDLAVQEFQHAFQLDSRNADALNGIAYSYESAGRIAEAEVTYKQSVALRPDYWDSYNTLGTFYSRHRRFDDAIAQLQHAIELTPDNTEAYNNLAAVYLSTGRPQDSVRAEKVLRKSLELGPTYPALANLGYLYLQKKQYAESAEMTRRVLQLNDKNFLLWENLDVAYKWLGEKDKASNASDNALKLLERAAKSEPRDAQVQSHLAHQYASKGMREKALTRVETALALAPDDPEFLRT
jgi:serine/threonine-protein kinase